MRFVPGVAALLGVVFIVAGVYGLLGAWWALIAGGALLLMAASTIAAAGRPLGEDVQ